MRPPTRLGVIGWPIAHSRSPAMHRAAIQALGLDYQYDAIAVEPAELAGFIRGAHSEGFHGINVTIPHKEAALGLCDPDALAISIGAVNTLLFEDDGRVLGTNTDAYGFDRMRDELLVDRRAFTVVLGAGGACRAVVAAMRAHGAEVIVVNRTSRTFVVGNESVATRPWNRATFDAVLPRATLLVDSTPRGLKDADDGTVPLDELPSNATVIDLVVRAETPLVRAARVRGLTAAPGTAMLLHQGARAFELWTGQSPPLEIMRRALESAL